MVQSKSLKEPFRGCVLNGYRLNEELSAPSRDVPRLFNGMVGYLRRLTPGIMLEDVIFH